VIQLAKQNKPMKKIFLCFYLLFPCLAFAQAGSEIYLFDLKIKKDAVSISNGKNITNHAGYDNQPSFHQDEPVVYYTSFNDEGRADIKSFNYKTGATTNVTTTSEREYSPTVTPDKQFLSCIIQRDNNAQDLGKYPITGGEPTVLINDLIVGYHTWINPEQLMLFVLGEPHTLQFYDLKTKQHDVIEQNIGRSLHKIPGEEAVSYVLKKSPGEWVIKKFEPASKASSEIITTPKSSEDLCWTPDGRILISGGMKLYFTDPQGQQEWKELTIDTPFTKSISRIAVSKDGKKLAVVVSE
jgi:Tol biopolymer transport system component